VIIKTGGIYEIANEKEIKNDLKINKNVVIY